MKAENKNLYSRRTFLASAVAGSAYAAFVIGTGCTSAPDFDILIFGGTLFDGTGEPGQRLDLGIRDGRIAAIGNLQQRSAGQRIDARGRAVCPGFVDLHSHSDISLLVDGLAPSKIRQGVTTEILGQDGSSVAPLNDTMFEEQHSRLQARFGLDAGWRDFEGYFQRLQQQGIAVNVLSMVGAGTLREYVVGYENRPATEDELQQMQRLLASSLEQGARHLSSGLEYTPGSFATPEELAALCATLGSGQIYSTHMRNEDDQLEEAVAEAIAIATHSGAGLNISHLKAQGQKNWHKLPAILQSLDAARESGLRVTCDRYPYVAYSTGLSNLFPLWSREGGSAAFLERLGNSETNAKIREAVQQKISSLGSWDAVMISRLSSAAHQNFVGRRLGALAQELGREPYDLLHELMLAENGGGGMVGFGMSEENIARLLQYPYMAVASDGSALATDGPLASGSPHPRNFGTFPRVLGHYVREAQVVGLSEAIRKMTSLPAQIAGLRDRGRLALELPADVVVFDPETIIDLATFAEPKQYPIGIEHVVVNGQLVLHYGEPLEAKPGVVLT